MERFICETYRTGETLSGPFHMNLTLFFTGQGEPRVCRAVHLRDVPHRGDPLRPALPPHVPYQVSYTVEEK